MIAWSILSVIFLLFLSQPFAAASDVLVPLIQGRIYVDGRPIDRAIQVRLETADLALVAFTATLDPPRFQFRNTVLDTDKTYYLVIRETGFTELRYELRGESFQPDSSGRAISHYTGIIALELESLPPDRKPEDGVKAGPKGVDVRQLQAKIPDEARREYNSAMEDLEAGKSEEGRAHLEKALELAPEYYEALNKLGVEYIKSNQYRKAESILERARAINLNDPLPLINLGILHFTEGDAIASAAPGEAGAGPGAGGQFYRKAVDMFEKALRLDPRSPVAHFYLGTALYKIGAYERAESLLISTLALDGGMHEARLTLLNIYTRQGRYKEALQQISAYLEANPDCPQREQLTALKTQIESILSQ